MEELIKVFKKEKKNEWVSGIVPGLLFHLCLSIVYCWSLIKVDIDNHINGNTSWAFSIMVAMVALTAIFAVPYVERKIKDAARYGAVLFSLGLVGSGLSCQLDSLWGLFIFFGGCLGIGAGLIYEVPLKIISKWFRAGGKGIIGKVFMVLSTLTSFIMVPSVKGLVENHGIVTTFTIIGISSLAVLMLAAWLIEEPEIEQEEKPRKKINWQRTIITYAKNFHELPGFIIVWLLLFINLSAGLAIISCERDLMLVGGFSVVLGMGLSRFAMPIGKGTISVISGALKKGNVYKVWRLIFGIELFGIILAMCFRDMIWVAVVLISFGYGASFAIQPGLLSDLYGRRRLAKTYSMILTAWALAGIMGTQISDQVYISGGGPRALLFLVGLAYLVGLILAYCFNWAKKWGL